MKGFMDALLSFQGPHTSGNLESRNKIRSFSNKQTGSRVLARDDNYNDRSRNPAGRQFLGDDDNSIVWGGHTANISCAVSRGFTLIELLVVVLIIGILAAVAVPQYQTAVDKARYSKIIPMTRALKDATEIYYMANGTYSFTIGDIDISGPAGCQFPAGDNIVLCADSWYDILNQAQNVMGFMGARYSTTTEQNAYRIWLDNNNNGKPAGQRECVAYDGTERAHRLCKAMGGIQQGDSITYILP